MCIFGLFVVSMQVLGPTAAAGGAAGTDCGWLAEPDTRSIPTAASCFHSNILQVPLHQLLGLRASNQIEG